MLKEKIIKLMKAKNAVLIAHYYVDKEIQNLAIESGGIVADSLDMAKFGAQHKAETLLVAGVRFMGETAKILSPQKTVIMPDLSATCSLDEGCNVDEFRQWIANYPNHTVVVYANTSAAVKAYSDWVVTSSIAVDVIKHLQQRNEKILWAPDKNLGAYINKVTNANMVVWPGHCIVHDEFQAHELDLLMQKNPDAAVLVHPESPLAVIERADVVGSTKKLLAAVKQMPNKKFIVATDAGMFHSMQIQNPNKTILLAPTMGDNSTCVACGNCPWMQMNSLEKIESALLLNKNEVLICDNHIDKARIALSRMVSFVPN